MESCFNKIDLSIIYGRDNLFNLNVCTILCLTREGSMYELSDELLNVIVYESVDA